MSLLNTPAELPAQLAIPELAIAAQHTTEELGGSNPSLKTTPTSSEGATYAQVEGMGAIVTTSGVTFRVWAPNAEAVSVIGPFNDSDPLLNPLTLEGDGYWANHVEGIGHGTAYKFHIANGEQKLERNDPYARWMDEKSGYGLVYDPATFDWEADNFQMPNWNEVIIYELHVGSFNSENGKPGTFASVATKLPYLRDLGINALKIMPPAEFPGKESWGYNPAYPFAPEASYGGPNGLKALIKEAHGYGIAVIIDVVYNHIGPIGHDLWQFDGWSENNLGGIYFYNDERATTPWGDTRPDYGRPEVRRYLVDNGLMWLSDYRADGLRVDSVSHIRAINGNPAESDLPDGWLFLQQLNAEVHAAFPWKLTIAEDLLCSEWVTMSIEKGGAGFSSQWDCNFIHPVRNQLTAVSDKERNLNQVVEALTFRYGTDAFNRIVYTESHDDVAEGSNRLVTDINPGAPDSEVAIRRGLLAIALAATAPGIPMLFQGQEFLDPQEFQFPENKGLDWALANENEGITRAVTDVFRLRRNLEGHSRGLTGSDCQILLADSEINLLVFERRYQGGPGDSQLIVVNFSAEVRIGVRIPVPITGGYATLYNTDATMYHPSFTGIGTVGIESEPMEFAGQSDSALIDIGPYSLLILSKTTE
jgi:1,4-alpha-glucan branching enzyme